MVLLGSWWHWSFYVQLTFLFCVFCPDLVELISSISFISMSFQQKLSFLPVSLASSCVCQQAENSLISHIEKIRFGNTLIIVDSCLLLIRNHCYIEKINDCWCQYKGGYVSVFLNIGPSYSLICFWFPTVQIHSANHFFIPLDWEFSAQ